MVEVDPFVLVGVGVAVVGVVGLAVANSLKATVNPNLSSTNEAVHQITKLNSKPKKKSSKSSKANKTANVDASSASELSGEDVAKKEAASNGEKAYPVAAGKSLYLSDVKVEETETHMELGTRNTGSTTSKKSKKGKETAEQKNARLERQKAKEAAKESTKELVDFASRASTSDLPVNGLVAVEQNLKLAELNDDLNFNDEIVNLKPSENGAPVPSFDGWAIVGERSDKKKKNKLDADDGADLPVDEEHEDPPVSTIVVEEVKAFAPVEEYVTEDIEVDSKKMGLLIGPKGVTKMGIQNITGAEINMPKVDKDTLSTITISVSGTSTAVKGAIKAIRELVTKGYATILTPENFVEGHVTVHPRYIADIIGKSGSTIKAIMNSTGVKVTTPANIPKLNGRGEPLTKVKIGLAGIREQVSIARNTILELCKYGHTAMTHPNLTHKELEVADQYYNYIIGAKGSEIKHIQANYKVIVTIPGDDSQLSNVLIVGEPGNVNSAEKHILRLIEKVETQTAERAANAALEQSKALHAAAAKSERERAPRPPRQEPEEPEEPWMKEFTQPSSQLSLSSLLPSDFAPAVSPTVASTASPAAGPPGSAPINCDPSEIIDVVGPSISKSTAAPVPSGSWGSPLPQPFL